MKTAVIYTSQTGFTKRYAQWLAEALHADCYNLASAAKQDFEFYDTIIYGGWLCAGTIRKIKWFKQQMTRWQDKRLAVFCVGASPMENAQTDDILKKSFSLETQQRIRLFYCPGGFDYAKMPYHYRLMMKLFIKTLKAKKDKIPEDDAMIRMISGSYDLSDRKYIVPIVKWVKDESTGRYQL